MSLSHQWKNYCQNSCKKPAESKVIKKISDTSWTKYFKIKVNLNLIEYHTDADKA